MTEEDTPITPKSAIPAAVFAGHILVLAATLLYALSRVLRYYDTANQHTALPVFLFACAILIGFTGLILFYGGSSALLQSGSGQNWSLILTGTAVYVFVLIILDRVFKRQFGSEIFFMFIWTVSEMNVMASLQKARRLAQGSFFLVGASVLLCALIALAGYILYPKLSGFQQFACGLIPWLAIAFFTVVILITLWLNRKNEIVQLAPVEEAEE